VFANLQAFLPVRQIIISKRNPVGAQLLGIKFRNQPVMRFSPVRRRYENNPFMVQACQVVHCIGDGFGYISSDGCDWKPTFVLRVQSKELPDWQTIEAILANPRKRSKRLRIQFLSNANGLQLMLESRLDLFARKQIWFPDWMACWSWSRRACVAALSSPMFRFNEIPTRRLRVGRFRTRW